MTRPALWRSLSVLFLAAASVASARQEQAAPSITELFQKGKAAFKLGGYKESLETFDRLDQLGQSASQADRVKLEPVVAFYRGANLAMLGESQQARAEFEKYLALVPGAHLDPGAFPKPVLTAFEAVKKSSQPLTDGSKTEGMIADYARFRRAPGASVVPDEHWADGAIRYLMTKKERETWQRLTDDTARAEFVPGFWRSRDPAPETPENEFRDEMERRIRYADTHLALDETRGSATDRGLVFVLLGPPSYVGVKPFKSEDDPVQAARAEPVSEVAFGAPGTRRATMRPIPRTGLTAETLQGIREVWHYRRDRLPKVVKFTEVDFEFITKKGFGTEVLQRDHEVLTTLDVVASSTLPPKN
ncbi:MAG: GWxTD domain-containing protein [Thermoanaerobaculia bacterium]